MTARPNVRIIAVGVENYYNLPRLIGPFFDVERIKELLVESPDTALFSENQFIELLDPTSEQLRFCVNKYVIESVHRDEILIFYFSGHGVPVGTSDFGFCTVDSIVHPVEEEVLSLSVVKFSDFLQTLSAGYVSPIVIIDACYSGMAAHTLHITSNQVIRTMRIELQKERASKYALLCSCASHQNSIETPQGGIFSHYLVEVASGGISSNNFKPQIGLKDIYPDLSRHVETYTGDSRPQLYLGDTLPDFPIVRNTKYSPRNYSFTPYFKKLVLALWNNGDELEIETREIVKVVGPGAYGNHRKLSFAGWGLLEDNPITKKRRLTEKGRRFARGEEAIPNKVVWDSEEGDYLAASDATQIYISDL